MNENKKKSGLISLNTSYFFRGIAIIMVIFSHYFEWGKFSIGNEKLTDFVATWGDYGVGIFLFLSGYALYKGYGSTKTDKRYVLKRIKNMYLPYLLIATVTSIWAGSLENFHDVIELLYGGDFWFITVIILIYVAFYFVGKLPEKYRVLIMTLFIIEFSLVYYIEGRNDFWYTTNWTFALGMIVSKYEYKIPFVRNGFTLDIKDYVFSFLGKLTIYIYVSHIFIYNQIINLGALESVNWWIRLFIAIAITVLVSFVLERLFSLIKIGDKTGGKL